jgi:hypothetical protein
MTKRRHPHGAPSGFFKPTSQTIKSGAVSRVRRDSLDLDISTTNGGSNRIYYGRYPDLISGVGEVGFKTDSVKEKWSW